MQSASAPARLQSLDVLRALAVVLTLCAHMLPGDSAYPEPIATLVGAFHQVGWAGVDLFFVLSGFLVSGLLFREDQRWGDVQIGRFLARRGFKIYPALYTVVIAYYVYHHVLGYKGEGGVLYADALFIGSYVGTALCGTWSLAVEEHFYLFLSLAVFALSRRKGPNKLAPILPLALLIVVTCTALRVWTSSQYPKHDNLTHHYATHLRMDGLMFGVALSYLYHYHTNAVVGFLSRFRRLVFWLSWALISPTLLFELSAPFMRTYGFALLYFGFGGLTLIAVTAKPEAVPFAKNPWVLAIGRDSYSIYLWHMEVVFHVWPLVRDALPQTSASRQIFADAFMRMAGAILFGRLMTALVEAPMLRLRERLFPARRAPSLPESVEGALRSPAPSPSAV